MFRLAKGKPKTLIVVRDYETAWWCCVLLLPSFRYTDHFEATTMLREVRVKAVNTSAFLPPFVNKHFFLSFNV